MSSLASIPKRPAPWPEECPGCKSRHPSTFLKRRLDNGQFGACEPVGCGDSLGVGTSVSSAVVRCAAWLRRVQRSTLYEVTAALSSLSGHLPPKSSFHRGFSHIACSPY